MKRTNFALRGALWRKAALCHALEGKPDSKLESSVEHYYTHEKNKFGGARRFVREAALETTNFALRGPLWRKRRFVAKAALAAR